MADHYRTDLIKDAIRMAAATGLLQPDAIFHADRGSNYTSDEFGRFLKNLQIRRSAGRTGDLLRQRDGRVVLRRDQNEWLHRFVGSCANWAYRALCAARPPAPPSPARTHPGPMIWSHVTSTRRRRTGYGWRT
ncbi:hypothetical protein ACIBF7_43860 [Nonomuraea sp. NPDC050478]|uniref:hypothetical protein n=1 Tax=Nonomuraea sp. NPDC050478 TaxID=3364365 RepID=UPI0037951A22